MHGPAVLSWLLAMLTAATGGLCLLRLRGGAAAGPALVSEPHGPGRESDAAEAVMGLGMAVMIVLGDRAPAPLWAGLFGLLGAGFLLAAAAGGPAGRRAHRLHHAVGALAMVYTALAMSGAGPSGHAAMAGMTPPGLPAVTGLLLVYFGGYALWTGSRLLSTAGPHPAGAAGLPQACRLAMGVGMFAMLLAL